MLLLKIKEGGVRVPVGQLSKLTSCDLSDIDENKLYDMYNELECDSDALED